MDGANTFTRQVRELVAPLWQQSIEHPFLRGIADGSLPRVCFAFYVYNDSYFLAEDARVLAIAASRARSLRESAEIAEMIRTINEGEQIKHGAFADELGIRLDPPDAAAPAPACYAYVSHLRSVALDGTLAELMAALLPCPWLYRDFGQHYREVEPPDPMYWTWLAAYGSDAYAERVTRHIDLVDRLAEEAGEAERGRMRRHFVASAHYEHAFWDMALHRKDWDGISPARAARGG